MPVGEKQTLRFGPFELDPHCGQLRKGGVGLKLQGQPVQILEIMLEKPGQLVTREELRRRLWPSDTFVDFDHSLNTAIKKLRQGLGDEADTPHYIETLPKRGYRFIGEVAQEDSKEEAHESPHRAFAPVEPMESQQPAYERRLGRWRRVGAICAAGLLGIVAVLAAYWVTKSSPVPRIVGSHPVTRTGYKKIGTPVTDGKSIYFQEFRPSGLALMQVRLSGGEPSQIAVSDVSVGGLRDISNDGSELLLSITDQKTGRSDAWIQPLPTGPMRLAMKDARWPRWTPDGRGMLFLRNQDSDLYRIDFDGTEARRLAGIRGLTGLSVSPDGLRIRFGIQYGKELWEAGSDGSNPHRILSDHKGRVSVGNWSPNGEYFSFTSSDGDRDDLWVLPETQHWWKKAAPQPIQVTFGPMWIGSPISSKDGRQLYAIAAERLGELSVYDRKSGQFVPYLSAVPACYADFSRDKQWVTYVSYPDGSLWRSRIDGTQRRQLTVPPLAVINPRWSPDGKIIAFTDFSSGDRRQMAHAGHHRIYVVNADGGEPLLLLAGDIGDTAWSPDGRLIAYGYHTRSGWGVRILDLKTRKSTDVPGSQDRWSPRWSPDGKYLAALGGEFSSKLMFYSFASKQWEELASGYLGWPSWSHDSKFVYFMNFGDISADRVAISNHKREQVVSLKGIRTTAYYYWTAGWLGLTPDDRPITTRQTGIEEVYSFDLEYK